MTSTMKSIDFVKLAKDDFIIFFYNSMIYSIAKLGSIVKLCTKLEKATKASFTGFFHAICFRRCPMARTALKHKHRASKFYLGVKTMEKSQHNDYVLKKLFVVHFFSFIVL